MHRYDSTILGRDQLLKYLTLASCCLVAASACNKKESRSAERESETQPRKNASAHSEFGVAEPPSKREKELPIARILTDSSRTSDDIWESLLESFPDLASGDEAVLAQFDAALLLVDSERHKLAVALCLLSHLTDPSRAIPFEERFKDNLSKKLFISGIISRAPMPPPDKLIEYIRSSDNDNFRRSYSSQLLSKIPLSDHEDYFRTLNMLSLDDADQAEFEASLAGKIGILVELGEFDARSADASAIMERLGEDARDRLAFSFAMSEVSYSAPETVREAAAKWHLDESVLIDRIIVNPSYVKAVQQGEIDLSDVNSWLSIIPKFDESSFGLLHSLVQPFAGARSDEDFSQVIASVPPECRHLFAKAVGQVYGENLDRERIASLRDHISDADLRVSFDKGAMTGLPPESR